MGTTRSRSFPARDEHVGEVLAFVAAEAELAGLPADKATHLELAVEEAVVNVCHYAFPAGDGELVVSVTGDGGAVTVELQDAGVAFDPLALDAPDTTLPIEQRQIGGLGVHLIRKLMDEVSYRREGGRNVLKMVIRKLPQPA